MDSFICSLILLQILIIIVLEAVSISNMTRTEYQAFVNYYHKACLDMSDAIREAIASVRARNKMPKVPVHVVVSSMWTKPSLLPKPKYDVVDCVVCLEKRSTHFIVGCGHACLCESCVASFIKFKQNRCPQCQGLIELWEKISL
jgi:hypothetical protein